jgi:hypothetical protein
MIQTSQWAMCDVCRLVDYNTEKKLCNYCSICDALICANCVSNWPKRVKAAILRQLEFGYKGHPNSVEMSQSQLNQKESTQHG